MLAGGRTRRRGIRRGILVRLEKRPLALRLACHSHWHTLTRRQSPPSSWSRPLPVFLAATKAAAAIAAALVTCQAATGQIGHTAASNTVTAAHRRGGDRPPRGPGRRPTGAPAQARCSRDSSVRRDNPDSDGGRTPAPHSRREEEEGDSDPTGRMERHDAGTDRQRQTGGRRIVRPKREHTVQPASRLTRLRLAQPMHRPMLTLECRSRPSELQEPPRNLS